VFYKVLYRLFFQHSAQQTWGETRRKSGGRPWSVEGGMCGKYVIRRVGLQFNTSQYSSVEDLWSRGVVAGNVYF